jgi:heat shock protein HslJ
MMQRRLVAWLMLVLVVAGACAAGTEKGGQIEGSRWVLRSYDEGGTQTLVQGAAYADASFSTGRVRGFAGCGTYDALARANGRTLLVSAAAVTLQSCGEELDTFQSTYLGLLDQSRRYSVLRGTLSIFDGDGRALLIFDAGPRNPLLGRWEVDSFSDGEGSVTALIEGTTLTATFRLTEVSGSAGCNTYSGTYSTNGNVMAVAGVATTRMACEEDVMAQEDAYLAALRGVAFVEPRGDTLLLTDRNGRLSVALVRPGSDAEPEASAGAGESAEATATPTASPTPTAEPTAEPTAAPTPTPTPAPTAAPTPPPAPSDMPTVPPPSVEPSTATCSIDGGDDAVVSATITYPEDWSTLDAPPELACRYFDPEAIEVPADPLALDTAVAITFQQELSYDELVTAATDPATWEVITEEAYAVAGLPGTLVHASALAASGDDPAGTETYAYLVDLGALGTMAIETVGAPGDTFETYAEVVDLIASELTIGPAS